MPRSNVLLKYEYWWVCELYTQPSTSDYESKPFMLNGLRELTKTKSLDIVPVTNLQIKSNYIAIHKPSMNTTSETAMHILWFVQENFHFLQIFNNKWLNSQKEFWTKIIFISTLWNFEKAFKRALYNYSRRYISLLRFESVTVSCCII